MGSIASFFTVLGFILILVPLALGMELIVFLNQYAWPASLVFWGILIIFSIFCGRKEKNAHDRWFIYTFPLCFLPVYCFLIGAIQEIVTEIKGFELILAVLFELPLCFMFSLGGGLAIGLFAEKFEDPAVGTVITVAGNLLFTLFLTSFGI
jgi:hypothetical protein